MAETGEPRADSYFLSYSRSDQAFALKLAKDVRAQGVNMWVDQLDIRPSEHWDRAIERAVRDCRGLVVVLSPRSVASDNVADEISYAIDSGKSVLPVMIERCTLPLRITRMQVIDATGDYQDALRQCLAELHRQAGTAPEVVETSRQPHDPEILAGAKRSLTHILGPIAGVLVDKAAAQAGSTNELHEILSVHIKDDAARKQFLERPESRPASAPPAVAKPVPTGKTIPPADVDALAKLLVRYVGPIASALAKRESGACQTRAELAERLATFIPTEAERAQFLREARSR